MEIELVNYSDKVLNVVLVDGSGTQHSLGHIGADGGEFSKTIQAFDGDDVKVLLQDP